MLNDERGRAARGRGRRRRGRRLPAPAGRRGAAARGDRGGAAQRARAGRRARLPHPRQPARRRAGRARLARHRDVRRLPARAVRPRRPALPLPVRQLHELRPALHDRARRALRPAAHDDGGLRAVPALRRPSTRTPPTGASTPSPNACPECGPTLRLHPNELHGDEALREAVAALREGAVVAVKGIGGYHLACLAAREPAVAALRARKHREDKPFAVMVRDVAAARAAGLAHRRGGGAAGRPRPPDRARAAASRRAGGGVGRARARADLGVLLPYSPLHHLLLADVGEPLVMTSGNVSDEPIAHEDDDALARLEGIADLVLLHDRPIHTRTDDSVLRAVPGRRPLLMRRSRGFVPGLAAAARRRRARCSPAAPSSRARSASRRAARAWVGHHIGDLKSLRGAAGLRGGDRALRAAVRGRARGRRPRRAPRLPLDARRARARRRRDGRGPAPPRPPRRVPRRARRDRAGGGRDLRRVGLRARRQRCGAASCWSATCATSSARGHLWPVRLPGGDRAVEQPWRMAVAWLLEAGWDGPLPGPDRQRAEQVAELVRTRRRFAADDEHGSAVRRGRRAVRAARRGDLRGSGGGRARGGGRRAGSGARTRCPASTRGRRCSPSPRT